MTRSQLAKKLIEAGMDRFLALNLANEDVSGGAHVCFSDLDRLDTKKVNALIQHDISFAVTDKGIWFRIS